MRDCLNAAAGLAIGAAMLFPMYALRACAAGDVKLMAVVGAFVGNSGAPQAVLYTLLAGGLLSAIYLLNPRVAAGTGHNLRRVFRRASSPTAAAAGPHGSSPSAEASFTPLRDTAARLPYAVAISLGTLASLFGPSLGPLAAG